jgi:uncharacterized protein YutE (UPF0331/DUF86 family)
MAEVETSDSDLLEPTLARYEAEGFDVFLHPSSALLPKFLRECRPDAIALRPDKKVAIELKHAGERSTTRLPRLRELLADHPDWELVVLYVSPRSIDTPLETQPPRAIRAAIEEVRQLQGDGRLKVALVMGWSALEAIGRSLLPVQLSRPQPPARLIETLAEDGLITPREAGWLRKLAAIRNAAVHGSLDAAPSPKQLEKLVDVLGSLSNALS